MLQPQCLRCGASSQAPICERCLSFLAAHRPLLFDPRLVKGPSTIELLTKDKRLMLTLDPKRPFTTHDETDWDWRSEDEAASMLKHMGFNGGAPLVLSFSDVEILHEILFHFTRTPPKNDDLDLRMEALKRRISEVPYLTWTEPEHAVPAPASRAQAEHAIQDEPKWPTPNLRAVEPTPPPAPKIPEPLPPEPPAPEPEEPSILPPPPDIEPEPPWQVEAPPDLALARKTETLAKELETMQLEVQRLSMNKAQMEGQRAEFQNMLQVEKAALEERELLVTAQIATLQARQKEVVEKEKAIADREVEMQRQRRRLELMEFLLYVPNLQQKDVQVLRARFSDLDVLRDSSLDALIGIPELGEAKSRELYSALHPAWSGEDEDLNERAQALLEVGDHHGALQCYEFLISKMPESENLWFNKAEILGMIGDREGALQAYSRVLDINKKNLVAWQEKADLLFEMGRLEEGIRALRSLIDVDRRKADAVLSKAEDLVAHGNERDAILLYNAILETDSGNVKAYLGLGDRLLNLGDAEMADKMYTRALGREPQNPKALYKKGMMLNRRGRWGAALQLFNRSIALDWNYADPWVGKGDILLKQGKPSEAIDCFQKALEFDPDRSDAWAGKAQAHATKGEVEEADKARAKALGATPDSEGVQLIESMLQSSETEADTSSKGIPIAEDSAEILKHVLKTSKIIGQSQILRRMADVALDRGDFDEAINGYKQALELDGHDVDAWCGMGLALRKLGRMKEAWEAYDRALQIDSKREDAKRGREACATEGDAN